MRKVESFALVLCLMWIAQGVLGQGPERPDSKKSLVAARSEITYGAVPRFRRCLTFEDKVEFFNLVLGAQLTKQEKADLVSFILAL
jgi:hypothetical protein